MKYLLLGIVLTLAGCGGGGQEALVANPQGPARVERTVYPQTTDAAITPDVDQHTAINPDPAVTAKNLLVVFLPGTGHAPAEYTLIQRLASRRGYHAVGLTYPNSLSVAQLCTLSDDADCHGKVRREVITGADTSSLIAIPAADSIDNRLRKLLVWLRTQAPTEGWGQYLDADDQIVWSKINLAGHSQGSGHAGVMTRLYAVNRVAYFSGPSDWRYPANVPATWTTETALTAASRQFGLVHLSDSPELAEGVWQNLGLDTFGTPLNIDTTTSFGTTHEFVSNHTLVGVTGHDATVLDAATPRQDDGTPLYAAVWAQMVAP